MRVLEGIKPEKVFFFFEELSNIPRGSGNEKAACEYCVKFAKERNLEVYSDKFYNVVIKKAASKGKEGSAPVILQGHLDMVCEKNAGVSHDFEKDPLKLRVSGDDISADGTTVGADNGIAVAIALAVLDDENAVHPALECFFTSEEEVGLCGAINFDYKQLSGGYLINIDSSEYGKAIVSCAGGMRTDTSLKANFIDTSLSNAETYAIRVRGLKGGHSGGDIHLERANANKLLGRTLDYLHGKLDYEIANMSGGAKDNAIPREAQAYINVNADDVTKLETLVSEIEAVFLDEYKVQDSGISVKCAKEAYIAKVFSKEAAANAIALVLAIPNGVLGMSRDIEGLVETSNNLGVITMEDDAVVFSCAIRSSVASKKHYIETIIRNASFMAGANFSARSSYPGWRYDPDSSLRQLAAQAFAKYTQGIGAKDELKFEAVHAGLECGIIKENMKSQNGVDIDVLSIGADIWDMHTPDERVSIASVLKTHGFVLKLLEMM